MKNLWKKNISIETLSGNGCGKRNFPGVYTNVYHYSQWIRQTINASPAMIVSSILMPTAITVTILTWSMFGWTPFHLICDEHDNIFIEFFKYQSPLHIFLHLITKMNKLFTEFLIQFDWFTWVFIDFDHFEWKLLGRRCF